MAVVTVMRAEATPQPPRPITGVSISLRAEEATILREFLRRVSDSRSSAVFETIRDASIAVMLNTLLSALDREGV